MLHRSLPHHDRFYDARALAAELHSYGLDARIIVASRDGAISYRAKQHDKQTIRHIAMAENAAAKMVVRDLLERPGPFPTLVFSYEALMAFDEAYIRQTLYPFAGLPADTEFVPPLRDSNPRYLARTTVFEWLFRVGHALFAGRKSALRPLDEI